MYTTIGDVMQEKVFISSVIQGMESYRAEAKETIKLMNLVPVMSEDFPASPNSSKDACLQAVRECNLFVLILGKNYGEKTEDGISVTHAEYLEAKNQNKPIFVFIEQGDKEQLQKEFIQEVENYSDGNFRKKFSSTDEFKKEIIKAISVHKDTKLHDNSFSEVHFNDILENSLKNDFSYSNNQPIGIFASIKVPIEDIDLGGIDKDELFTKICKTGATKLSRGYETNIRENHIQFISGNTQWRKYENGLFYMQFNISGERSNFTANYYCNPNKFMSIVKKALCVNEARPCWVALGIKAMEMYYFDEPESLNSNTIILPSRRENEKIFYKQLSTTRSQNYEWISSCVNKLQWKFGLNQNGYS